MLCDTGSLTLTCDDGTSAEVGHRDLAVTDPGSPALTLAAGEDGARVLLLGGEPFEEEIIMWWNFVGRTTEEITNYRDAWEAESEQFGTVEGYEGNEERFPAPPLPGVTLRARHRRRNLS